MNTKEMVGVRIRDIRTGKRMTQEQLAEKMGNSTKYLSSIERGKENPTLNTLIRLAEGLDVDLGAIFRDLEIEDPLKRKALVAELVEKADEDQIRMIARFLAAVLGR